ncbi:MULTISPECIES: phosphatase PAP2 family protein [unclassified Staphylococcus]|uniref:phosphatase PAP2 family protein n=1 Tax=unclassified Staphylococcus TaxID=91994 RepID=UPI0021D22C5B|nr:MULTISPECIES: phosphatase PAP2 family protein [unclassified Staphylococcus]UXR68774.1 phosphatase PAP2 family protein [Staphylococcus sp. IVB6246]UXR70831.1 phosphatase PAP2 family protein [Staphylococcus sp. IVB6240]UXR73061.1 phosphatase PAP2 family protein [Staphylococcus sp. IVB6238]UXR75358.1 phosphatase PAP2 family protein [Staphylococcus sp. IVB6233]UXR79560.1 phosphatase PAP2 family protein [Staphylococcus sp. IVB6218]
MTQWKRILCMFICMVLFVFIAFFHTSDLGVWIDDHVYKWIFSTHSDVMTWVFLVVTHIGEVIGMAILTTMMVLLLMKYGYRTEALYIALTMILAGLTNPILKHIFNRERPSIMRLIDISGFSFPSGHAMGSTAFFGSLLYIAIRILKGKSKVFMMVFSILMILLICASRIYLGVHYPTDILAGILGGLFFVIFTQMILRKPLNIS